MGVASIWAPASQDSSHVGNAGVGVVSLRSASLSLTTSLTAGGWLGLRCRWGGPVGSCIW